MEVNKITKLIDEKLDALGALNQHQWNNPEGPNLVTC